MTTTETFDDPASNFAAMENASAGMSVPSYVVQQVIGWAYAEARKRVDNLGSNLFDQLYEKFGPGVVAQVKAFFRDHPNLRVEVNFPREGIGLPWVGVVDMGEEEGDSFVGDHGGFEHNDLEDGVVPSRSRRLLTIPENGTLDVVVGTDDPNLTLYLAHFVKFVLVFNKLRLDEFYDLHNLRVSARDIRPEEAYLPSFAYARAISLRFMTTFNALLDDGVLSSMQVGLHVQAWADGDPTAVTVVEGDADAP